MTVWRRLSILIVALLTLLTFLVAQLAALRTSTFTNLIKF